MPVIICLVPLVTAAGLILFGAGAIMFLWEEDKRRRRLHRERSGDQPSSHPGIKPSPLPVPPNKRSQRRPKS